MVKLDKGLRVEINGQIYIVRMYDIVAPYSRGGFYSSHVYLDKEIFGGSS